MFMYEKILFDTVSRLVNGKQLTDGIEFTLTNVSDMELINNGYKFTFNVKFTKDVSYQQTSLEDLLYDVIETATLILSINDLNNHAIKLKGEDLEDYHIGKDLYGGIDNTLSSINQVNIRYGVDGVKLDVQHVDTKLEITDDNSFKVINYVKPITGYLCNEQDICEEVSVKEATDEFLRLRNGRPYDDSEFNYLSIDELMGTYKAFTDNNQVIYVLTEFV